MNSSDSGKHPTQRSSGPRRMPDPAICHGQLVMKPDIVRCRVDWPIFCIHAHEPTASTSSALTQTGSNSPHRE